jgi:hypothetical protein
MSKICCKDIKNLTLNCKEVVFTVQNSSTWYNGTAPEVFTMCEGWKADINITYAAANWDLSDFIDLFVNKLHTFESGTHSLTIPSNKMTAL